MCSCHGDWRDSAPKTVSACDIVNNMCEESKWIRPEPDRMWIAPDALFCAFCHTVAGWNRISGEVEGGRFARGGGRWFTVSHGMDCAGGFGVWAQRPNPANHILGALYL
jgi:hypothetical protein